MKSLSLQIILNVQFHTKLLFSFLQKLVVFVSFSHIQFKIVCIIVNIFA